MKSISCFGIKLQRGYVLLLTKPFVIKPLYFLSISFVGFGVLKALKPRTAPSFRPANLDLFFTSVSATTVSSMATVEMEVFSNAQLIVLTVLMFAGGGIFTSLVGLHFQWLKLKSLCKARSSNTDFITNNIPIPSNESHFIHRNQSESVDDGEVHLKYTSIKFLSFLVLGHLLVMHVVGVTSVVLYLTLVSSARRVLEKKGLKLLTFSVFTVVSTFGNCGFVPTNENMVVFSKNSGLLLILIPQVLLGETLFAPSLRLLVWVLGKFVKQVESKSNYLLKNAREIGYGHLLPSLHSSLLAVTVVGFILLQFVVFCSMDWNLAGLSDLNPYRKVVGVLFQVINSRHAGESIADLSTIAPAILVLFVVMMYLPAYTSFLPVKDEQQQHPQERERKKKTRGDAVLENLMFSQLSYPAIFIILICITERKKMKQDPLNFSLLNIVVEVISAYGNVGFSTGYSCARMLEPDVNCQDKWYGFSGKWSDEGKTILIVVMFFGRLKEFSMDGGRAWKLH